MLLLCAVGIRATAQGQQTNSVSVGLTSLIIQGELNQVRGSLPYQLTDAPAYVYSITGNVHGEGPIYSVLVPGSEPVGTAFESIHKGLSSVLQGSVPNPGAQLPATILSEQVTSGTDRAFNALFSLSLDATGLTTFAVTNVAMTANGQPDTTDRLVFDSGNVTVTALFADVSVATLPAANITPNGATLQARVFCPNNFQAYFVYGTNSSSFSGTTAVVSAAASGTAQNIFIPVTGLLPHQVYYFQAVGADITGPSYGSTQSFKTGDGPLAAGSVTVFCGLAPLSIPVLAYASDPAGDALKVVGVTQGVAGRAAVTAGGAAVSYRFTSGIEPEDHFTYTVSDGFGGFATGNVNVVNYATLAATYSAVLLDPGSQNSGSGFLRVTLSPTGQCTGSLTIAGVTYPFRCALDWSGRLSATLSTSAPAGTAVTLNLAQAGSGYVLNARVAMDAMRLSATLPPAWGGAPGTYTFVMPPPRGTSCAGSGYALVKIASNGLAAIAGALPDGAPFSCQTVLNSNGQAGVFSLLYAAPNRGSLAGSLALGGAGNAVLTGSLVWTKPACSSAGIDPGPFSITLSGSGGRYLPQVDSPALRFGTAGNTGRAVLSAGNLNSPILHVVAVAPNNVVTVVGAANDRFALTIQHATGLLTGHFNDPLTGMTRKIQGALLQGSATGGGYFLGDSVSGSLGIGP